MISPVPLLLALIPAPDLDALGARFDPAPYRPDLEVLEGLAHLGRRCSITELREGAGERAFGDPGRAGLILASAWARGDLEAHRRWLVAVALAGDVRSGRAAVHALAFLGAQAELAEVIEWSLGRGDALTRCALAVHALDSDERVSEWLTRGANLPRVGDELRELAQRTRPDVERWIEEARGPDPWAARRAWRRLVPCEDLEAREAVVEGLLGPGRPAVFEALVTWRGDGARVPLVDALEGEDRVRLEDAIQDRRRRAALKRQ